MYKVNAKKIELNMRNPSLAAVFCFLAFLVTFYYVKCLNFTPKTPKKTFKNHKIPFMTMKLSLKIALER